MRFVEGEVIGHRRAVEKVSQRFMGMDAASAAKAGIDFAAFTPRLEAAPFQSKLTKRTQERKHA